MWYPIHTAYPSHGLLLNWDDVIWRRILKITMGYPLKVALPFVGSFPARESPEDAKIRLDLPVFSHTECQGYLHIFFYTEMPCSLHAESIV